MKTLGIYAAIALWAVAAFSQDDVRFMRWYTFADSVQSLANSFVKTTGEGYLLVSTTVTNSTSQDYYYRTAICGLDPLGNQLWSKEHQFSNGGQIVKDEFIPDKDGNYWMFGDVSYRDSVTNGFVFKFSATGDSLFFSEIEGRYVFGILPVENGYVVIGAKKESYNRAFMAKYDTLGSLVWEKVYPIPYWHTYAAGSLTLCPDGGFVFGGALSRDEDLKGWVVKTDSIGNKEWVREFPKDKYKSFYSTPMLAKDGHIYVQIFFYGQGQQNPLRLFYAKLSMNNELMWERDYNSPGMSRMGQTVQFMEDRKGNMVAVGNFVVGGYENGGGYTEGMYGYLLKISPDGDSLCSILYAQECGDGVSYSWSLDTTLDGGVITGSMTSAYDSTGQFHQAAWVVKYGSNWCDDTANTCPVLPTSKCSTKATITQGTAGTAVVLAANDSAEGYQWIDCAAAMPISGATQATFEPTENGSYAVAITFGVCVDTSACLEVDNVGITENTHTERLAIFPNPTSGSFRISELSGKIDECRVTDSMGREVAHTRTGSEISLNDPAAGIYFVQVQSGQTNHRAKLIVISP